MTEMKHTPTPWLVQHEFDNEPSYIVDEQDVTIGVFHSQPLDDWSAYENAAFIVRAVNAFEVMQKALLEVQEDYRDLLRAGPENDESDEINKMLEIVDNALAVSRGE